MYEIDTNDNMRVFNGAWLEVVNQSGGSNLRPEDIVDRSVWDFIHGRPTRHLYDVLFRENSDNQEAGEIPVSLRFAGVPALHVP